MRYRVEIAEGTTLASMFPMRFSYQAHHFFAFVSKALSSAIFKRKIPVEDCEETDIAIIRRKDPLISDVH